MRRAILLVFMMLGASPACLAASSVPFRLYRDYLILTKCSVAGHDGFTAVIDTGTTETIVDLGLMKRLRLQNWEDSATSLNQDASARGVRIPGFDLGPVRIPALDGVAMDLSAIGRELGVRPDVVVGMDVLQRSSFTIDYERRTIEFGALVPMAHRAALVPSTRFGAD